MELSVPYSIRYSTVADIKQSDIRVVEGAGGTSVAPRPSPPSRHSPGKPSAPVVSDQSAAESAEHKKQPPTYITF